MHADENTGENGIGALDVLLDLANTPDRIQAALHAIHDPATVVQHIPPPALRLAMAVASPASYQLLVERHPDAAERLERARDFVVTALPGLALAAVVPPALIGASTDDGVRSAAFVRGLRSIGHAKLWVGPHDALLPAVRVVFTDDAGERAFDEVLDWADILFVADSLLKILADSMHEGTHLIATKNVRSLIDALPQSGRSLTESLQVITALAERLQAHDELPR